MSSGQKVSAGVIAKLLTATRKLVVISHYNPDGDAFGSSLALTLALRARGHEVVCVNESPIIERFRALPGIDTVTSRLPSPQDFPLLVACDCANLSRVGDGLKGAAAAFPHIVNIDHHISNDLFGRENFVDGEASSASELIFDLITAMQYPISAEVATLLFAGIMWDTGSFTYSSTTAKTFGIGQELLRRGAVPHRIAEQLFESQPLSTVRLQADALLGVELFAQGTIAEVIIPASMYAKHRGSADDTEGLVERARGIHGVQVAILIRAEEDLWKISLRGKDTRVDLSEIAQRFGGGGHRMAAAFRWRKSLEELRSKLRAEVEAALQRAGIGA